MEIRDKRVIVTGGGAGMGLRFALDLQQRGARVFALDVVEAPLQKLHQEHGIEGAVVDVSREEAVEGFFRAFAASHGAPHVLINNAGITADALLVRKGRQSVRTFPSSSWHRVLDVNLTGVFLCGRAAAAAMVGQGVRGVLINISSISRAGNYGQTNYSATKAGVAAMSVTWARELAPYGIRSAAIAPGYINTEMIAKLNAAVLEKITAQIPLGRLGEMEEISRAVQFIIECDFYNGRVLEVDGGHRI